MHSNKNKDFKKTVQDRKIRINTQAVLKLKKYIKKLLAMIENFMRILNLTIDWLKSILNQK